jgi:hypothetical protein
MFRKTHARNFFRFSVILVLLNTSKYACWWEDCTSKGPVWVVNILFRGCQKSWRGKRSVAFDAINLFPHDAQAGFSCRAGFSTFRAWSRDHTCSPQAAQAALRPSYLLWCAFLRQPYRTRNARTHSNSNLSSISELGRTPRLVFDVWMEGCHQRR